ncbi:MAG: hypothetical protein ACYS0E_22560, partial [Planctomycetota bacterium]
MSDGVVTAIGQNLDRARVYGALALLFRAPDVEAAAVAREQRLPALRDALERLTGDSDLTQEASALCGFFEQATLPRLCEGHRKAFDESSADRCAPTEMDQLGGAPQLELTRTFEMADGAGFYKAFGVEVAPGEERPDHIAAEL